MSISKHRLWIIFKFKEASWLLPAIGVCLILSATLGGIVPFQIKKLGDVYGEEAKFYEQIKVLFFVFFAVYANRALYQLCINKFIKLLMHNARNLCYGYWVRFKNNESKQDRFPMGEVIARIMSDTEAIRELITSGTFGVLIDVSFVVSSLISFISINTKTGSILAIAEFAAAVGLIFGSKYMRSIFLKVRESRGYVYRSISNASGGFREMYYNPNENYASVSTKRRFDDFLKKQLVANFWDASYYSFAESLYPLFLLLVIFLIPYSAITETAVIFAILDLIQRSINPVKDISGKVANLQRAATGFIRISEFLEKSGAKENGHQFKVDVSEVEKFEITVNKFEYENSKSRESFALKEINFTVKKGEVLGIAGFSGSGKSTLLKILVGRLPLEDGLLSFQGQNGTEVFNTQKTENSLDNASLLKKYVGLVSQDSHVFGESLLFNLTFSNEATKDFEDFWEFACSKIPYLQKWKGKLEERIERSELSAGQRQLISGLRCCYLKKPVILLDEISASLDSELEVALRELIKLIQTHSITLIVAHRIETILESDRIFLLEQGRIVADGHHQDLVSNSSRYRQFLSRLSLDQ
ncbi:MAG: ATP-binding cassette domain-containing protein [Bacteriovoracaceae bacterium]